MVGQSEGYLFSTEPYLRGGLRGELYMKISEPRGIAL
jgi:hypothetical protein